MDKTKIVIKTTNAPGAIGPYSQGIAINNLVFTSGQLPINSNNGLLINEDIKLATKQAIENVKSILEEAGTSINNVIKTTVFLRNLDDFSAMNEVYATYFPENCPARSCFEVSKLPMDAIIEIEAIAVK